MGKRITSQKRGRGSPTFRTHGLKFKGEAKMLENSQAYVADLVHCAGHTAPLVALMYENGDAAYSIAADGLIVGQSIDMGSDAEIKHGNIIPLKDIPEGVPVFNIEARPNDGGKFVRASGGSARVVSRTKKAVVVEMPSRKRKEFHPDCRATIGAVAGSGRTDKPFLKAGKKYYAMKARNKYWPIVSASAMNAVAHPMGNKRTLRKSKGKPAPKNAPPGRKVGAIRPRQTGRGKRK